MLKLVINNEKDESMWYVEGKFPWGTERYEMLTREQSRAIHSKMSRYGMGGPHRTITVQSGVMEGIPDV